MSASLVGSEMCIRDSTRALRRSPELFGKVACLAASPTQSERRCRKYPPVSYTHLTLPTICSV
eukprot:11582182-Alexandrium_andersonii.AAC.1